MYQCPKCCRTVYCGKHVCNPAVPDSQDIIRRLIDDGVLGDDLQPV